MAFNYTPQQQSVIDLRNCNILVSAAAGSGKTAVLTQRIVSIVCDEKKPIDIDKILIVTFTNAAAAQMRERIANAFRKELEKDPQNAHIRKQLTLLHTALITTIDSFCLYLLHNHFEEIDLDPAFRIADEGECKLLKQDVLTSLIEAEYENADEDFLKLCEMFAGNGKDTRMKEMILSMFQFAQSHPFPEDFLNESEQEIRFVNSENLEKTPWMQFIFSYEKNILQECRSTITQAMSLCSREDGPASYLEALSDDADYLQRLCNTVSFKERIHLFHAHDFMPLSRKKDANVDEVVKAKTKQLRDSVKKVLESIGKNFYYDDYEQMQTETLQSYETLITLLQLTARFTDAFWQAKKKKNLIDFSDLEHLALKVLLVKDKTQYVPTETAKTYQSFFEEIMVDEYQDSNFVQEMLLESISRQTDSFGNRFMVGDVKQSIYRFRLARPEIFMEKYNHFANAGRDVRIDLSQNFRSRAEVIDSVNSVFEKVMTSKVGNVEYDDAAHLYRGAAYPASNGEDNKSEVLLGEVNAQDKVIAESVMIAQRIKELLAQQSVMDEKTGTLRPVRYKDIVILLRTASGYDEKMKRVFENEGIPTHIVSRSGYFAAPEIQVILNFLSVLSNPRQDIPLLGVMHSYLGKFSEAEIAEIRVMGGTAGLLYDSLVCYVNSKPGEEDVLYHKSSAFLKGIERWRERAVYTPVYKLLEEILFETDYLNYCTALPAGEQRRGNLRILLQRAKSFSKTTENGLFDFIRSMELMKEKEVDFGEANLLDENADVVRIMTIHKSKGLEFPICFVAGLGKTFNRQETADAVLFDADIGVGMDYVDLINRISRKTLSKNAIACKKKVDSRGEDFRILYVALTRAKEKMILCGTVKDAQKYEADESVMSVTARLQANNFLDLILPGVLARNDLFRVHIFTEEDLSVRQSRERTMAETLKMQLLQIPQAKSIEPFVYPHDSLEGLFIKTTVSELKKAAYLEREEEEISQTLYQEEELVPYIPLFARQQEEESGGAARGTAYHRIMELLARKKFAFDLTDAKKLSTLREEFVKQAFLSKEDNEMVSERKLLLFLSTTLAKRMKEAAGRGKLYAEQPFVLSLSAALLNKGFPKEESVLVQGVIDAYFEEEEELVIVDYKTDQVTDASELVKRYCAQLDYYAQALERLEKRKVKEKIIYSFALHEIIVL